MVANPEELLFSINAAIKICNQLSGSDGERVTNAEHGCECDRSAGFNLLPMPGGKAKPDHVFLSKTVGSAQLLYSFTEGAEELFLVDQACVVGDSMCVHHEQIGWIIK
jgi:hypothetical protein